MSDTTLLLFYILVVNIIAGVVLWIVWPFETGEPE